MPESSIGCHPCAAWQDGDGSKILEISGDWLRDGPLVKVSGTAAMGFPVRYHATKLGVFDSTLPAYLLLLIRCVTKPAEGEDNQPPALDGLPDNLRGLLELALAVPEENTSQVKPHSASEIRKFGKITLRLVKSIRCLMDFTGKTVLSLGCLFTGKARFRSADFWMILQHCGVQALPIVSLISFLIGAILALVGNVQLANFDANLFVADLVGIAMVREMGVVMTAIIISGRTGAAFAALLGSMNPRAPTLMRLQNALVEVERSSRAIKELATDLKRNPDALLRGKDNDP